MCRLLALSLFAGCAAIGSDVNDPNVSAEVATSPSTVIYVSWETDLQTTGHVEFWGEDGEVYETGSTELSTEHRVPLLGMPADTEVSYRVVVQRFGESTTTDVQTITTGSLPLWAPEFAAEGELDGGFVAATLLGDTRGTVVLNSEGQIVWWYTIEEGKAFVNRVWPSVDGKSMIVGLSGGDAVVRVPFDGGDTTTYSFPGLGHEFVELPDGRFAGIGLDAREVNGVGVMGNTIVEVDHDGTVDVVWSAWDLFTPSEELLAVPEDAADWIHANAIDYDVEEDAYYVNLLRRNALVKVDAESGRPEWVLGGDEENDFKFVDNYELGLKHQFEVTDDGLYIFHNGDPDGYSSVVHFWLDQEGRTVDLDWEYAPETDLHTIVFGDVELLDSGTVHSTWGSAGVILQLSSELEETWSLTAPVGAPFAYSTPMSGFYAQ